MRAALIAALLTSSAVAAPAWAETGDESEARAADLVGVWCHEPLTAPATCAQSLLLQRGAVTRRLQRDFVKTVRGPNPEAMRLLRTRMGDAGMDVWRRGGDRVCRAAPGASACGEIGSRLREAGWFYRMAGASSRAIEALETFAAIPGLLGRRFMGDVHHGLADAYVAVGSFDLAADHDLAFARRDKAEGFGADVGSSLARAGRLRAALGDAAGAEDVARAAVALGEASVAREIRARVRGGDCGSPSARWPNVDVWTILAAGTCASAAGDRAVDAALRARPPRFAGAETDDAAIRRYRAGPFALYFTRQLRAIQRAADAYEPAFATEIGGPHRARAALKIGDLWLRLADDIAAAPRLAEGHAQSWRSDVEERARRAYDVCVGLARASSDDVTTRCEQGRARVGGGPALEELRGVPSRASPRPASAPATK